MAPPRLFTRFALVSGIALVAAVALALLFTRSNAHDRAKSRAVAEATAVAKQFADNDLARTAFDWPPPSGERGRDLFFFLDDFFVPTVDGADAASVTLYSRGGTVTYAADRNAIGTLADDPRHAHAAVDGPQYVIAGGFQNTYVPVTSAFDPGRIRGVMRLQHGYHPIASEIQHEFLTQAAIVALALVGLYLAMLPIMRRVTQGLRRASVERAELAAIVDHSNDAVIGVSRDNLITSWNAAAEGVYGWTAAEAVGRPIDDILPEKQAAADATEVDVARTMHVRKNGTPVIVSITISPIRDADGAVVGSSITSRDVTEVARLEQELRDSHRQQAVGRGAGGLAHDFSDVLGEIDAAAANLLLDPSSQRDLERIRTATARGSSLSEQLQAVGGGQTAEPELVDLNEAVRNATPRLNQLAGAGIAVTAELEDGLGRVFADREQIDQLIVNLVANARGSMPRGGRITIETASVDFERRSRDGDREPGHYVMFSVADTGSLAAEAKARPFEPFYRQNGGGEGRMALALAAVSGIVKQSGGTLGVESRPEGGTIIRIYLPRVGASAPTTA